MSITPEQRRSRTDMFARLIAQEQDGVIHEADLEALKKLREAEQRHYEMIKEAESIAMRIRELAAQVEEPIDNTPYQQLRMSKPRRNEVCPCGSGKKYKKDVNMKLKQITYLEAICRCGAISKVNVNGGDFRCESCGQEMRAEWTGDRLPSIYAKKNNKVDYKNILFNPHVKE